MAVGLTGIGQMGAGFWTIPLFYGGTLLVAVGLSGYAARRLRTSAAAARDSPDTPAPPPSSPTRGGGAAGTAP
jgi:ribose transport system permease protein